MTGSAVPEAKVSLAPSTFFIGIAAGKFPNLPAPGLEIGGGLRLTTDRPAIARIVSSYSSEIGNIEEDFLLHSSAALIYKKQSYDFQKADIGASINGHLITSLAACQNFLTKLWLVKDNAIISDIGWMAAQIDGETIVNSNSWSSIYSKADGSASYTTFSRSDLIDAIRFPFISESLNAGSPVPTLIAGSSDTRITKLGSETERVERFMYFVDAARSTRDLPIKIANYCSGLEALVSSSHNELTHQVAERVASLLKPRGSERIELYRSVKTAYAFRSKAVHGASFKEKEHEKLVSSSRAIDEVCRELLLRYLSDESLREPFNSDTEAFSDFWISLLLS